ncbi:MAG: hypothetical protein R2828_29605 [Saprospiraceae bacterium]
MSLRTFLFLVASLTYSGLMNAQVYHSLTIYVEDSKTNKPLKGATIAIKELGFQAKATGSDGKVFFQDTPVGEIHFFITCDGYSGEEGTFNISSKEDDNTLKLSLLPISLSNSMILVSGEVVDAEGIDIEGASVELVAGNVVKTNTTNRSGSFNIELNLDEVTYNITEFRLEVTKGDCKEKTKFAIPKNNYIYKEIKINCSEQGTPNLGKTEMKKKFGEWDFTLTGCEKSGNTVTCGFIIKSSYRDRNFTIYGSYGAGSLAYDEDGIEYKANLAKLGNQQNGSYVRRRMVANVPTTGNVIFQNISTRATTFSLLEFYVNGDELSEKKIQFRDVPIK